MTSLLSWQLEVGSMDGIEGCPVPKEGYKKIHRILLFLKKNLQIDKVTKIFMDLWRVWGCRFLKETVKTSEVHSANSGKFNLQPVDRGWSL